VGVLGEHYPGYFAVGDTDELRRRLLQAEGDTGFLERLERDVTLLAPQFSREREKRRFVELLGLLASEHRLH